MYINYCTKNLEEYYKILRTLNTCETAYHYEVVTAMLELFYENCTDRINNLRIKAIKYILFGKFEYIKQYKSYKRSAVTQFNDLAAKCKEWIELYSSEQNINQETGKDKPKKKRKVIYGFNKLFK